MQDLTLVLVLAAWIAAAAGVGWLAASRGHSFAVNMLGAILISPLLALLLVLVRPRKRA